MDSGAPAQNATPERDILRTLTRDRRIARARGDPHAFDCYVRRAIQTNPDFDPIEGAVPYRDISRKRKRDPYRIPDIFGPHAEVIDPDVLRPDHINSRPVGRRAPHIIRITAIRLIIREVHVRRVEEADCSAIEGQVRVLDTNVADIQEPNAVVGWCRVHTPAYHDSGNRDEGVSILDRNSMSPVRVNSPPLDHEGIRRGSVAG